VTAQAAVPGGVLTPAEDGGLSNRAVRSVAGIRFL